MYAPTLDGLRKKEEGINGIENAGASCNDGGITVIEFVKPQRIIANRKKPDIEYCVDGYSGFLLLDKNRKEI